MRSSYPIMTRGLVSFWLSLLWTSWNRGKKLNGGRKFKKPLRDTCCASLVWHTL